MTDQAKRATLKTLTAVATVAAVPGVVQAALTPAASESNLTVVMAHMQTALAAKGVSLDVIPTPEHPSMWVRFKNDSDSTVSLDQVSPCLIRSGGKAYDINSGLQGQSRQIAPNQSCAFMIDAM